MAFDLTSVEEVRRYLLETHSTFKPSDVVKLSGGFGNFGYRVFLENYYAKSNGQNVTSVIFKHAAPYVAADPSFPISTERQDIEAKALRHVSLFAEPLSLVSLPELYQEDSKNRVLIMEDLRDSITLKYLFQTCPPSEETCEQIGTSLGTFLARLHTTTAMESDLKTLFESNAEGRRIAAYVSYGSLRGALGLEGTSSRGYFDPPIIPTDVEINKLDLLIRRMEERILTNSDVLAMGDFWPGNILVGLSPKLQCTVIDWEMTRPGPPGLDIGQFVAELLTLRAFHPSASPAVNSTLISFLKAYHDICVETNMSTEQIFDLAWDIATRCGTYMVVTTSFAAWGSKERTRQLALDGLSYIFNAVDRNVNWLQSSIICHLLA